MSEKGKFCHFSISSVTSFFSTALSQVALPLVIGGATGGAILIFCIMFLSYCIVINVKDRREYQSFKDNEQKLNWNENGTMMPGDLRSSIKQPERSSLKQRVSQRQSSVKFSSTDSTDKPVL